MLFSIVILLLAWATIPQSAHASTLLGDINNDGKVDIFDLAILHTNYGRTGVTSTQGDLTNDGIVNIYDFSLLLSNLGKTTSGTDTPLAPTGLTATVGTNNSVVLHWNPVANAVGYTIERNDGTGWISVVGTANQYNASSYTMTGLTAGKGYFIRIAAYGGSGTLSPYASIGVTIPLAQSNLLTWSPPSLVNPITIPVYQDCATSWRYGELSPTQDYIIQLPSQPVHCGVIIKGGRNVMIKGGYIRIPNLNDLGHEAEDQHRALTLKDQRGTAFIEGLRIDGEVNVPVTINNNFHGTVILQNIRGQVHDHVLLDPSTVPAYHGECIQAYGGPGKLLLDNFTCETNYFGFQFIPLKFAQTPAQIALNTPDAIIFNRVNVIPEQGVPDTTRFAAWWDNNGQVDANGNSINIGSKISFNNVWFHANSAPWNGGTFGTQWQEYKRTCSPSNNLVWPQWANCSSWPKFNIGDRPSSGDFVPASSVGLNYSSPGYLK